MNIKHLWRAEKLNKILSCIVILVFGIVFILAGINGWKFPSIYWYIRETKFGEVLNSVIMVFFGLILICVTICIYIGV